MSTHPDTKPQTFAFVKIDLGSCYSFILDNRLLHSLYVQVAGHKDGDIIGVCRNPCYKRASKRDTMQVQICPLLPKPSKELQSKDIEKRRQGATLLDRLLALERLLFTCLRVAVHYANPSAELRFESGSLQNRCQKLMVNTIEGLGLI